MITKPIQQTNQPDNFKDGMSEDARREQWEDAYRVMRVVGYVIIAVVVALMFSVWLVIHCYC